MPPNRYAELQPLWAYVALAPASATAFTVFAPTPDGRYRFDMIQISSTAAIDMDVELQMSRSSIQYPLGSVRVPAGAGHGTVPPVEALAVLVKSPNDGLALPADATVRARVTVTLQAGEAVNLVAVGGTI